MSFTYTGTVVRVVDGDTIDVKLERDTTITVDLGFYIYETVEMKRYTIQRLRLNGIDTPELRGAPDKGVAGRAAKAEVERLLTGRKLRVETYKGDKYGRWLADVYVLSEGEEDIDLVKHLIENGYGKPYHGGKRK